MEKETKEAEKELRLLKKQAREVWLETARKRANPYVDNRALWLVGAMAEEATRWEDGLVIIEAIQVHMDGKSSPRRIPEWARITGAQQRELHHMALKHETYQPPAPDVLQAMRARLRPLPRAPGQDVPLRHAGFWDRKCVATGCNNVAVYKAAFCATHGGFGCVDTGKCPLRETCICAKDGEVVV